MEDSSEKSKKVDDETDRDLLHSHCPFWLPICDSILQPLIAILRLLGFNDGGPCRPTPSSPEECFTRGSDDESEQESEYYRRHVPPRPPWSTGGGGQTD